jgi:phage baseplate assembly protein W
MLPVTGNILERDFKMVQIPSKTFRLDTENKRVTGMVDGLDAVKQAVFCILNTERFEWLIYSWNYGVELNGLFWKSTGLVKAKIKKRIKEALQQDDRIQSVDTFSFESNGRILHVSFIVHTTYGEIMIEKEVSI